MVHDLDADWIGTLIGRGAVDFEIPPCSAEYAFIARNERAIHNGAPRCGFTAASLSTRVPSCTRIHHATGDSITPAYFSYARRPVKSFGNRGNRCPAGLLRDLDRSRQIARVATADEIPGEIKRPGKTLGIASVILEAGYAARVITITCGRNDHYRNNLKGDRARHFTSHFVRREGTTP